ncbi:unnamed protein product [Parajaminaea phylloscopi]
MHRSTSTLNVRGARGTFLYYQSPNVYAARSSCRETLCTGTTDATSIIAICDLVTETEDLPSPNYLSSRCVAL